MMMRKMCLIIGAGLVLAACGSGFSSSAQKVEVTISEGDCAFSTTDLNAGVTVFRVTNKTSQPVDFVLTENEKGDSDVKEVTAVSVIPQQTAEAKAELHGDDTYHTLCGPVEGPDIHPKEK